MVNFHPNIDNIIESTLVVKASGSIVDQAINDLQLPDGENIEKLIANEELKKKQTNTNIAP